MTDVANQKVDYLRNAEAGVACKKPKAYCGATLPISRITLRSMQATFGL